LEPLQSLLELHAEIDRRAGALMELHAERLECRVGCADCCVDELSVFGVEAARIRQEGAHVLAQEAAHPGGACAFLDAAGACRIYTARPYVCRTQGLPLRWLDESEAGEVFELRDICPLNEDSEAPLTELEANTCWTLGPFEARLQALQAAYEPEAPLRRVSLRGLFTP
jgi:Fe-S-cluster containining protein